MDHRQQLKDVPVSGIGLLRVRSRELAALVRSRGDGRRRQAG